MEQTASLPATWSRASIISFRFLFIYFILYIFPFPFSLIPYSGVLFQPLTEVSVSLIGWIAQTILGVEVSTGPNGSGDTTYNYLQILLFAAVSILMMTMWTAIDPRRVNHEKLRAGLIILMRYFLGVTMLGYGLVKVFKSQFPFPSTERLSQTFGEASPMGLLWTFMGYSTAYNIFTGLMEVFGGGLLLFRRTRMLGALIVIAVMSNVVMLNFSYDVPVKLFSLHLLIIAIYVLTPDAKRLMNFLFSNKPTSPELIEPIYRNKKTKRLYIIAKSLMLILTVGPAVLFSIEGIQYEKKSSVLINNESLLGEYQVETFTLDGQIIKPDTLVTQRWKKLVIRNWKTLDIQYMDETAGSWHFISTGNRQKIVIHSLDLSTTGSFTIVADSSFLTLEGNIDDRKVKIVCTKTRDIDDNFLLVNRGFHWINEYPFNR
jgi:hypothetical protein